MQRMILRLLLCLCCAACCTRVAAQTPQTYFMSQNNSGTEFFLTFLPAWPMMGGANSLKLYITAAKKTVVTVEVRSEGFVKTIQINPYTVVEIALPVTVGQPYFKTDKDPTPPERVYRQHAVQVTSKEPITCYAATLYLHSSDAYMALPVASLGTEYTIASAEDIGDNKSQYLPSMSAVVAAYDNTKISFTLGGTHTTMTAGGMKVGETKNALLNKGDVWIVGSFGQYSDLSGSHVVADKPVSVISGNYCAFVPRDKGACDHLVEAEIPRTAWGKSYIVPKIFGRLQNSFIKVIPKEPNTKISLDGKHIYTIKDAGGLEDIGYMTRRVAEGEPRHYAVTADKPVCIHQYNPGLSDDNVSSDPFQMVLPSVEQYRNDVVFSVPGVSNNASFTRNYVAVMFGLTETLSMPHELEWGEFENGVWTWMPLLAKYGTAFDQINVPINNKHYGVKTITLTRGGVYAIRSPYTCGAVLYGFSSYDSYGMPAGMYLRDLTVSDSVSPVLEYTLGCADVINDARVVDPVVEGQSSKLARIGMVDELSYNYTFTMQPFEVGAALETRWSLAVIDKKLPARAVLFASDRAGNTVLDTLLYFPIAVATDDSVLNFGKVNVRTEVVRTEMIRNPTSEPVVVEQIRLKRGDQAFSMSSSLSFPLVIPAQGAVPIDIRCAPATAAVPLAVYDDTLEVNTACNNADVLALKGVGIAPVIKVYDWNLSTIAVGKERCISIEVLNTGTDTLVVTGMSGVHPPYYVRDWQPSFPVSIPPNKKMTFSSLCVLALEEGVFPLEVVFSSDTWSSGDSVCVVEAPVVTDVATGESLSSTSVCYPNPSSGELGIEYSLQSAGQVRIELYTSEGSLVRVLFDGIQSAGQQKLHYSLSGTASGSYRCRIVTAAGVRIVPITIVR